ncbi:hypothetical protein AB7M45_007444 [Bradyrhizobium elkanii]
MLHEDAQLFGHRGLDLEPDHRPAAAALERGLEQANEVFGLFLDFEFGVPDDSECALALDGVAGEQAADEQTGCLLQRDQPRRSAFLGGGDADEAVDLAGHADQRVHRLAVGDPRQLQRHREAEIRDERERMRRVDRQRRQQREDVVEEVILDPAPLGPGDVAAVDQLDADLGQDIPQVAPDRLLVGGELRDGLVDHHELLGRQQAVRAALGNALADLRLDAGDTDHEELVEVIRRNRQEADPLQHGMAEIDRFLEHPPVEMQPGELPVDEALGAGRDCGNGGKFRLFFFDFSSLCRVHQVLVQFRAGAGAV